MRFVSAEGVLLHLGLSPITSQRDSAHSTAPSGGFYGNAIKIANIDSNLFAVQWLLFTIKTAFLGRVMGQGQLVAFISVGLKMDRLKALSINFPESSERREQSQGNEDQTLPGEATDNMLITNNKDRYRALAYPARSEPGPKFLSNSSVGEEFKKKKKKLSRLQSPCASPR